MILTLEFVAACNCLTLRIKRGSHYAEGATLGIAHDLCIIAGIAELLLQSFGVGLK